MLTVTAENDAASWSFGNATFQLQFDFDAAASALEAEYNAAYSVFSAYEYDKSADEASWTAIKAIIDSFKDVSGAPGEGATYSNYVTYSLYNIPESKVESDLKALADETAAKEAAYQNTKAYEAVQANLNTLKGKLTAAKTKMDGVDPQDAPGMEDAQTEYTTVNGTVTAYEAALEAAKAAGTAVDFKATRAGEITTMTTAVETFDSNLDKIKTNIASYKGAQEAAATATTNLGTAKTNLAAVKSATRKATIQSQVDALEADAETAGSIAKYLADAKTQYEANNLTAVPDISTITAVIAAINTAITTANTDWASAVSDYTTADEAANMAYTTVSGNVMSEIPEGDLYKDVKDAANTELTSQKSLLEAQETAYDVAVADGSLLEKCTGIVAEVNAIKAAIDAVTTTYIDATAANITAYASADGEVKVYEAKTVDAKVKALIDDLRTTVDAKNTSHDIATYVASSEYSDAKAAIDAALVQYDANEDTKEKIAAVQTKLDNAKTTVAAYKTDGYDSANYWESVVTGIQTSIDTKSTEAQAAYDADPSTASSFNSALDLTSIETAITAYDTDAKAAFDKFNDITSFITTQQADLDADKKEIKDYDTKEGTTIYNDYNFEAKFATVQGKIDAVKTDLEAAVADVATHSTSMGALATDASVATDLADIMVQFKVAQDDHEAQKAKAARAEAKTSVEGVMTTVNTAKATAQAKYDELAAKTPASVLVGASTDIDTEKAAIESAISAAEAAIAAVLSIGDDTDAMAAYNAIIADNASAQLQNVGAVLQGKITAWQTAIENAIATWQANEEAKAAADTELAKLDGTDPSSVLSKAKTEVAALGKANRRGDIDWTDIDTKIATLKSDVTTAYDAPNQTLGTEWGKENGLKKQAADLLTAISAMVTKAHDLQDNFDAFDVIEALYNTVKTKYDDAVATDVKAAAGSPAAEAFLAQLDEVKDGLPVVKAGLTWGTADTYEYKAKADAAGYTATLNGYSTKIDQVLAAAAANKTAATDLTTKANEVQAELDALVADITANDASTLKDEWLDKLAAVNTELADHKTAINTEYAAGTAKTNQSTLNATTLEIQGKIQNIQQEQADGYAAAIAEDNAKAYAIIDGDDSSEKAIATKKYEAVKAMLDKYAPATVDDPTLASVIATQANDLNNAMFNFPSALKAAVDAAAAKRDAANAVPERYDQTSDQGAIQTLYNELTTKATTFETNIKAAANDYWTNVSTGVRKGYQDQIDAAGAAIASYDATAKDGAFADVKALLAEGDGYVAAIDKDNIGKLNTLVKKLADEFGDMLTADKNNAAKKDLDLKIATANALMTTDQATLNGKDLYDDDREAVQALFDTMVANSITAAATALAATTDYFGDYTTVKSYVDTYDFTSIEAEATAKAAQKVAYIEAQEIGSKLQAAATAINATYVGSDFADKIEALQARVDALDGISDRATVITRATAIETDINTLKSLVAQAEWNKLNSDLTELKNQYNKWLTAYLDADASHTITDDAVIAHSTVVNGFSTTLGASFNVATHTLNVLQPLEAQIASKLQELKSANGEEVDNAADLNEVNAAVETLKVELTAENDFYEADLATVDATYSSLGYNFEDNRTELTEAKKKIDAAIDALKASVEAKKDNIQYYKDKLLTDAKTIQDEITALQTKAAGYVASYQAYLDKKATNDVHYTTLSASFTELLQSYDEAIAEVGVYTYGGQTLVSALTTSRATVVSNQSALETANGTLGLDDSSVGSYNDAITTLTETLASNRNAAAQAEARGYANTVLDGKADAANAELNSHKFAATVRAEFVARISALSTQVTDFLAAISTDADAIANLADRKAAADAFVADYDQLIEDMGKGTLGDANGDGKVSVSDYSTLINYIIGKTETPADITLLDINEDGELNVADATAVANLILFDKVSAPASARPAANVTEGVTLTETALEGNVKRIALNLTNAAAYVGYQVDVQLPEGMKLVGESLTDRANGQVLRSNDMANGTHRILATALRAKAFTGNEGAVLYFDVELTEGYNGGAISIENITFADTQANETVFMLGGEATGIDSLNSGNSMIDRIYNVGGKVMNAMKKGINIVRRADGTTEKVVVK